MKPVIAYKFDREIAKRLGRAGFLQKHAGVFPHLDLEMVWDKMFPEQKKQKRETPPEADE